MQKDKQEHPRKDVLKQHYADLLNDESERTLYEVVQNLQATYTRPQLPRELNWNAWQTRYKEELPTYNNALPSLFPKKWRHRFLLNNYMKHLNKQGENTTDKYEMDLHEYPQLLDVPEIPFAAQAISLPYSNQQRQRERGGEVSRVVQVMSTVAAVLIVTLIVGSALVLFSHRPGSFASNTLTTATGALPATVSEQEVLYTRIEPSGQVQKADILAVNPKNGSTYWKATFTTKFTNGSFVPHSGLLFAPGYDGYLYALNARDGKVVWKYSVKDDPAPTRKEATNGPRNVFVDGNTVYFSAFSGFYALDMQSGKLLWHVQTPDRCQPGTNEHGDNCDLLLGAAKNGRVYAYLDGLYVYDGQTGKELWHDSRFQYGAPFPSLVEANGKVYVYSYEKHSTLRILNASDGKELAKITSTASDAMMSLLLAKDVVYYADSQRVFALRGTQTLWTQNYQSTAGMELLGASDTELFVSPQERGDSEKMMTGDKYKIFFAAWDTATGKTKWSVQADKIASGSDYQAVLENKLYFFSAIQRGNAWIDALFALHDGKLDAYPLAK